MASSSPVLDSVREVFGNPSLSWDSAISAVTAQAESCLATAAERVVAGNVDLADCWLYAARRQSALVAALAAERDQNQN